ncbi:MAG: molybdenum cofactor guanylyltransferase [Bacteroidetes bacterium]|nr:MAG: molybdenum cofactor guanylyltransferase [Bacteroidota bacterium]
MPGPGMQQILEKVSQPYFRPYMTLISKPQVTGIILAGGKSSRFGSDKALFEYQGKKLVEYSIEALKPLCNELLISTNQPEKYDFTRFKTVTDMYSNSGPVGGIHACLKASSNEHNLVIGCDMPFLKHGLFLHLLKKAAKHQVVIPMHNGFSEPLAAFYSKSCYEVLEESLKKNKHKILDAIQGLQVLYLEISQEYFYDETLFFNVNFRSDLDNKK